jgi:hypothetical protein
MTGAEAPYPLQGGCLCGRIRYRLTAKPMVVTHCHCTTCRRASGAPFITWMTVTPETFAFTQGEPDYFRSSPDVRRGFCATCGTTLAYINDKHPEELDIAAATLDRPDAVTPADHIQFGEKVAWIVPGDGLAQLHGSHWTDGYPDATD